MTAMMWCLIFMCALSMSQSQISQSMVTIEQMGTDFIPANSTELIETYTGLFTSTACYYRCHFHPKCRTAVSDMIWPFTCRLYESSIDTGTVIFGASSASRVAAVHQNYTRFSNYNQSCESNSIYTSTSTSSTTTTTEACEEVWQQCGGQSYSGPTCCVHSSCIYVDSYYSQCRPMSGSSTSSSTTVSSNNNTRRNGVTTRYWDCCKPSCAWGGKASVTNPVQTCAIDGLTSVDVNTPSVCTGGTAFTCNNQQPWSINATFAFGYVGVRLTGQTESNWCCACYSLIFTSGPVIGKEMIVQATNTGGDLGADHFDLQMPGGGMGYFSGCLTQYTGPYSWGLQYGGVSSRLDCANLPSNIQDGCHWRFDWFMNADNPDISFKEVSCPSELTARTSCIRNA